MMELYYHILIDKRMYLLEANSVARHKEQIGTNGNGGKNSTKYITHVNQIDRSHAVI